MSTTTVCNAIHYYDYAVGASEQRDDQLVVNPFGSINLKGEYKFDVESAL